MKCPYCPEKNTAVKDSREADEGRVIRRRRHCNSCGGRFTTFERIEMRELIVVKRGGSRRPFDREKIKKSISTALRKRNFTEEQVQAIASNVIVEIESLSQREIDTKKIGKLIMKELENVDQVAYVRFASVYKDFATIRDFTKFISKIKGE